MRFELAFCALAAAGCASAGNPGDTGTDAGHGSGSSHVDAPTDKDAPSHPIDAPAHIDAAPDSPTVVPPDACVPTTAALDANLAFDGADITTTTHTKWHQDDIEAGYDPIFAPDPTDDTVLQANSPDFMAWLGGFVGSDEGANTVTDDIYEDITIPAGTTQLVLTGNYLIGSTETTTTVQNDTFRMEARTTANTVVETILTKSNLDKFAVDTFQSFTYTFTNPATFSGTKLRLYLTSTNSRSNVTNFFFDTMSLTATYGCP